MEKIKNEDLGRKTVDEYKSSTKTPIVVVLDNVRSGINVGSIFRTADSFLLDAIYLCGITGQPPQQDILKSALGATETVTWKYFADTADAINELKSQQYFIISIEQAKGSIMLNNFVPEQGQKIALVFGHEVQGVQQSIIDVSDACIEIPQIGTKHSLNVSVCSGIVVWDIWSKMNKHQSA